MNKSFPVMIRMIASILIITFFAQDVVWANPEIFVNHQSASTLQIPSFFQNVDAARILEVNLRRLLAYEYTPSNPQHLVLEDRGVRMEVALPPDSKGIISCATIVSGHKSSYKARILPDKSIELIPAQEQLELDFKKPAAPKVFVSPTSLHRPARYIATMLRDITKEDSRVTAAVQALLDMLERNMHSSYMIQEAVGGIRNDISKYGYISARTFQRLSGIVSGVLVNWRKSRKGKDLILGRLARMKARIDGRDMSLIDLDVSLYKQMSIEWPIEKDAMQHIALLLAGIVSGIRISAEKLDEHSRVRPRFDEIASDINAIQKWIKTGGKYPQKDLQNCEEAIRAIVKNISGDGDTRAQILILADKISALRPVLEKIQKNLAIPSKGVWFSLVRVPYEHILLSAAPLEGDDLKTQAESLLSNIDKALAAKYCSRDSIVRQTVFLKNLSDKKKCQAIMSSYYGRAPPPAISYVIQAPASGRLLSIEMTAIPKQSDASLERIDHNIVIVKHDGIRWAYVAGLEPKSGIDDTYEQASDVFGQMERILTDHGFKFENVVRTWIYQGRITGDDGDERQRYDKLNEARYKFFKTGQAGGEIKFGKDFLRRRLKDKVFPYPASTGISMNDGSFVMECLAISTNRKDVEIVPIENPRQTPVYLYGGGVLEGKKINPLFSRGMDVLIGNSHIVFVSGTASIIGDENTGNNIEDQTEGSIENIRLVLKEVGIGLRDIAQLRVYIRDSGDCEKVKNIVEAKFGKTTRLEMIAGVCRKNLLVEIEAVAYSKLPDPAGPADWISQRKILDYYLDPQNDILHEAVEIPEFEERNREIEYAIFKRIVDVYKFRPFRRLEKERKTLLAHFFLPNILPPSEKRKSGIETPKQSESRSEICKKLLFDEILSNRDPGIYRPALGAIIEILAKEKKLHSTYFFDKFYPILEESGKLPRFAEALIDTLISVEHHKEQLFYISDEAEFFDETKHIIRDLASRLPSLRRHIVSYLFAISRKSTVEIPLVRRLLDDLGFYMVSPKEFNQFSALKVAEEIWALQRSRPDRPVVLLLAGGVTMPGFLYELAKMYGINWQRVEIFQHSEYRGKGLGSDYSIANTIEEYLVKEVYAPGDRKHVHYIGADPDPRGYMEELYRLGFGGADILILGVGSNGHIGYNEPGKPSEANGADSLKLVGLSESTVQGIISYNPDIRSDPYAYTMSPAALMKARSIFLFANGSRKAQIVKDAFANPLMPEVPVSEILEHRDVSVVLDSEAVKELTENAFDEYVKTEYALRESKDRLNVLINGNLPPSHEIDREGTIKWISQEEADMLGYNPAQMIGRPIWEFVAPEEQEISQNAIAKKVSFQQELPPFERKYKRSDGTYIWVYIEEIQIVNNAGKVTGILSNMANINEAKLKHEELEAQAHDLLESLGSPDQNGGSSKLLSIHPIAILFAVLFPAVILIIAAIVIYIKVKRSRIARLAHIKSFNAFIQGRDDKTGREWVEHGGMRLGIREIAGYIDKREAMGATLFANVSDTLRQKIAGRLTKDGAQYLAEICRKLQIELAGQSDNIRDEHLKNNSLFVRLYKGAAIGVGPTLAESDFLCIVEAVPQEKNVSDKHVIIRIIDQKTEKEITSLDLEYGVTCEISREGVEGFKGNKIYHLPVPSVKALSGSKHLSIRVVERDGEDWIRIADLGSTNGTNVTLNTYRYHVKPVEVVQKPVLPETGKASGGAFTGTKRKIIRIKSAVPAKLPSGPGSKPTLAVLPFYDIYSLAAAAIIFALVFLLEKPVSCIIKRMNLMRSLKDPHWYSRIDITRQFAKDYPGDVMSVLRTLFRNERDNRVREAILNLMGNYGSRADLWAVDFMEEVAYSRDASDAIASVAAIGAIGGNYAAKRLILIDIRLKRESLFDTDAKRDLVRQSVMQALGKTGSFIAMNYLSSIINKKDLAARHAVLALGYPVYKDAVPLLRECVKSDDFRIRRNAQEALDNIGPVFAVVPIKVQDHDGPEILESIESIKAIKKSCSTAFVIGVYHREDMKTIPKSHESPLGEDALRKMVDQLQSLHKINPLFNWKLILACSVGLGVGSAHHTERAWKNIQDSYKTAGDPLDSSQVEILRIGMMEDGNINSKKSGAILFGMHEALSGRFDYIGYAEMGAIDLRQAGLLIGSLEKGEAEVAIGSRWMKGSSMKNMPLSGTIISKICNWFTRFILPPLRDIKDPQTEFKIFKKDCLVRILPLARDGSIAFNAELLLLAQLEGYKIKEVPVHWVFSKESESERMFLRYLINLNLLSDFNRLSEGLKMISGLLRYRKYLKESYWNKSAPTDYNGTGTAMLKGFAPFKNMYTSLNRYCAALFAAPALEAVFVIPGVFAHPYAPLLLGIAMAVFVSLHIFNINRQEFARAPPLEKAKILFKTFFAPLLLAALTFYIRYSQGITGIDLIMYNFSLHLVINYFALKTDGKIFHVATAGQSVAGGLTAAATPVKNTDTWRMKIAERLLTVFMRLKLRQTLKPIPADIDELPPVIAGRSYYLYIHIPFCESLCPYCSFHRQLYDPGTTKQYFENLRREMRMAAKRGYKFSSLYIGGGTPTVDVDELIKTIDLARELFDVKEVSCETHAKHLLPTVVGRLAGKVDRISVGVQSLNDDILARMKRYEQSYSGADVIRRIADMQGMFRTMNVDMIYNLPGQTVEMLEDDIRRIIASGAEQITFYPLMTSPVVRASLSEAMGQISYRNEVAYYAIIVRRLKEAGFEASSPWCFSRNKSLQIDEYIARSPEYVGLGSGAFSYLNGNLYVNTFSLEEYADRIAAGKAPITGTRRFSSKEQMRYRFMMDLFNLGLDTKRFAEDFGVSVARGLWMEMAFMRAAGAFGKNEGNIITLTKAGRYFMVVMMREFFSGINNLRDQARQHIRQPVPAQPIIADKLGTVFTSKPKVFPLLESLRPQAPPVALITPTIEGYRGMSTKDVTVRVSHGKIDAKTSLMVDELPYVEWDSRAREQITNFLRYYRGIIRDIRLYKSGNNFRVLFVMEDNSGHRRGFIRNPKIFNQNLIVHLSKILKYLSRNIGSTEDKRELLARSQMALFWTILGVLSERASGIYERFFNNTADEYIKELEGPSARIPEEYNRDSFFKDYIGGYSRVYALEIERIEQFLSETKKDGKELEVNIYDLGPWAGLFAPVAAARLDAWAKRNSVLLKATFYIVDPDLNAFEKLGEVRYKKFTKLYKAEAGKNSGLVFEYNTPKTDESLGGGYAQNVVYRPGSIVLANDFYEHIEGFEGQILSRMAGQNSIGLQFVHVPYEAKPDTSWGHVNSFNSANLKSSFGRFFGPGYDLEVIDDPEGKGGFLTIRANALIHETYPLRFLEQCSYIRRVLPSIIASKDRKNGLPITIRIFSLRCSSGEEIASVSATINHELSKHPEWGLTYGRDIVLDITGVDQSQDILDQATAKLTGGFDANEYHKTYPETLWPTLHRQTDFVNKWMPSGLIKHTTFVRSDISDEDVLLRAAQADIVLMNTALIYNTKEKVQGVLGTLSKNMTDRTFILTDFLTICAHLVTFVELRELFTVTPLSGDGQTSILLSKKQSPVHPVSAMPSTADAGTGLAPAPETTAPMTELIAGGDKEGQYGSHLIGKVFRKNREALELVTENIVGQTEEAPDGGRTLVLCESIDRDVLGPLYTKDGEEARVKLTGKMILSHSGKAIYIFEDHKYIKGFSARGEAYLAKSLEDNRMAVFHEATESNMIELSKSLLTKIHPHTLLRGCGKDIRLLIDAAVKKGDLKPEFTADEALEYIEKAYRAGLLPASRKNENESKLISYNEKAHKTPSGENLTGFKLLYGEQDWWDEKANHALSRILRSKEEARRSAMGLKRMLSNKENALAGKLEKMLIAALLSYRDRQSTDTQSKISKDRIKFFAHIMARGLYQMDNTMLVERGAWKVLPPDVREIILSRSKVDKAIIDDVLAPKLFALLIEYVEKKLTARQAAFFAQRLIPYEVAKKLSKDESITEADAVKFIMYYSTGVAEAVRLYKERLAKMKKEFSKELARGKLSLDEIDFFAYSYKENTADAIRGFLDKIEELKNIFKAELESGLVTMYLLRSFSRRGRLVDAEGFVRNYLKSVETEAAKNTISPGTVHYTVFNNQDAAAAVAAFRRDVDELKIKFAGEINSGVLLRSEIIRIRRAHPKLATAEEAIRIFLSNVKLLTEKYAAQLNKSKKERELVPSVMRRFAFNSPEDPVSAIDDYLEKVNGLKAQYAQEIKDGRMSLRTIADIVAHFSENAEQKINKFLRKHPAKNSVIPQATNGIQLGKARVPYEHILLSAVPVEGKTLEVQMNNLLSNVDKALKEKGCDRNSVFKQAVFLKNLADKDKCREIMGEHYGRAPPPATSYIIQAPANGELLSIEVMAIPKSSTASIERVDGNVTIVKDSGIKWAYISGLEPDSDIKDTYKQAADVFARMRKTLADHGFKFENILRTWIYQGHITDKDDDGQQRYDKMNEARWNLFKTGDAGNEIKFLEAFIRRQLPEGVFPYPASTGIDMNNGSFVMECVAISTDRNDIEVFPIENPRQTSVYKYEKKELFGKKINPLFSRGMAFVMGNSQCIFVSGTASIIKGLSIGSDAAVQTEEAIENVRLVLNEAGAGLKDIAQLRVYVKYQSDYEKVKRILDAKFDKTPRIDVIAGVCRQDLLVEIEAIAYTKAAERPKPLPDTKKIELRSLTTPSDVPRPALKPTRKTATAQAAAVVDGKTKEPIVFLRKIVDTKELTQNMIEGILSALFSNKKPTFAFSRKLKGLELEQLSLLVEQLNKWKEATAKKNPKMKKLLDNFTVFTYDDLTIELGTRGIDVNDKDGLIFTYEPQPKEETGKLGSAIRRVYITEPEKGFPTEYYYPLLEMVTVSVAKELLGWDEQQLKDAMVDSGITIDVFGIEPYIDDKTGILIFNILPKMELYDNSSRINRYTRLLQFLRAA